MFYAGSLAEQQGEARRVGDLAQQCFAGRKFNAGLGQEAELGAALPQVAAELPFGARVLQPVRDRHRRFVVTAGVGQFVARFERDTDVAKHRRFEAGMTQFAGDREGQLELQPGLARAPLLMLQQAEIATRVALPLTIPHLVGQQQRLLELTARIVVGGRCAGDHRQVASDAAFCAQVAAGARQRQRGLVSQLGVGDAALAHVERAERVQRRTRHAGQAEFGRDPVRLQQVLARGVGVPALVEVLAERAQREGFALAAAGQPCRRQCRIEALAGQVDVAQRLERVADDAVDRHALRVADLGQRAQALAQVECDAKRPGQAQHRPGAFERPGGCGGIARRAGTAACRDEVVGRRAAVGRRGALVERGEVVPMPGLGPQPQCRAAAVELMRGAEVLAGVLLHAAQQIEAVFAEAAHHRLLEQRLDRVEHPGVRPTDGKVEHGLGIGQSEAALEHRELRERTLVARRQQIP